MILPTMRGRRIWPAVALATGVLFAALPATAQDVNEERDPASGRLLPQGTVAQPTEDGPGAELRRNLNTLAANPRSTSALIGAGRAALAQGDGTAALSFFGRADEIEPNNPRVKAGMASAFVLLEQAPTALRLFQDAVRLGAPEVEIAGDRGLAYDMTGDPRRAQQDYALVLRRGADPEVERRMALSLAISGQREAALRVIDNQLRRQDRAAWRAQAFVLALTGDVAGASDTARRMMPANAAQAMAPFLARLAALSPAQKAMAVHFGHFPSDGRVATARSDVDAGADPGAVALAQSGARPSAPPRVAQSSARPDGSQRQSAAPRRRPDSAAEEPVGTLIRPPRRPAPQPRQRPPVQTAEARPQPVQPSPDPAPPQRPLRRFEPAPPTDPRPSIVASDSATAGFTLAPQGAQPRIETRAEPPRPPAAETGARPDFDQIAALVASLPDDQPGAVPPAQRQESRPAPPQREARAAQTRPSPARPPAHPARHWVQIATVSDRPGLGREFVRLRTRAPEQLRGRTAHSAPYGRSSNRLLVGPFDTPAAARAFVNQLAGANISAFAWTSEAGQEIERVQIR